MRYVLAFIMLSALVFAQAATDYSEVSSLAISLVNQDPDPALAGDVVEVRVGVENLGGASYNGLVIGLGAEYPFQAVSGEELVQAVGSIGPYQGDDNRRIVKFRVRIDREATAGTYDLKIKYGQAGDSARTEKSLPIGIQNRESAEVIYIDKTLLVPGDQSNLRFTINNVGNAPLRDLKFYWENEEKVILPVGSDNTKYVKYIEVGESAELDYQVIADTGVTAGLYELNLYLSYDDPLSDTEKLIQTNAGVYVGGGTDFEVAFAESSGSETSFTIANIGSNPASSVSVMIPEQAGWRATGSSSMIIGNLDIGDYTVASFTLSRPAGRPAQRTDNSTRAQPLKVQVAYTDTRGERNIVSKEVAMGTATNSTVSGTAQFSRRNAQPGFFTQYKWYLIAAIALLGGGWIYFSRKKRMLRK